MANLNRRVFLRGVGGAVVAAPFLGSVAERAARGQAASSGTPRRLIVMFTHYGCLTDRWFPTNSHGELSAADFESTSLAALAPHASKLLVPRGIRAMNEWSASMATGQGNDPHTQVVGSYFTCVPVTPHSDDPFNLVAETKFEAMPTAPSLDHVCARQLNANRLPFFVRVGGRNDSPQSGISYSAGEQPFDGYSAVGEAFDALTGLAVGGAPTNADSYELARGRSVIDLVRDDLLSLEAHDMSQADSHKIEAWKDLLNETTRAVSARCTSDAVTASGLTDSSDWPSADDTDPLTTAVTDSWDYADLHSNLAVLSALCDHSRVTFLKYPPMYQFAGLGIDGESHALSHRIANATGGCLSGVNELLETIDRYYAAKFAHLVSQLDGVEEGDGTLLDGTAAVWFQEMSDGNAHNLNNMPLIQAGSCGGFFKTGVAVNVDGGTSDLHRGSSSLVCDASNSITAGPTSTGTPAEFGNAPINKYYCSLMNAIGVKAGADGFPMEGGTGEVTHYGMYDDTADFASGGEAPPQIKSPGGFDELKAS